MIKKIIKIKNIGKYDIPSVNEEDFFGINTLIFGANKIGKTTLVAILRSLRENDVSIVSSRKTFGTSAEEKQECEIVCDDGTRFIYNSSWSYKNIEIFDNEFINRNIFIGDKIEQGHKAQLHKILIDETNLGLQKNINLEEIQYAQLIFDKEQIRNSLGKNFNEFIKFKDSDEILDVDIKIKNNLNKRNQYNNHKKINQLKVSTKLSFNFLDFEIKIEEDIDNNLEKIIKKHIENCWNIEDKDFSFLAMGVNRISNNKNLCPFCGQGLENVSELMSNMKIFFGEAYKMTQMSIESSIKSFKSIDIEKEIAQFKAEGLEFLNFSNAKDLAGSFDVIIKKLDQKQKDLSLDIKIKEVPEYNNFKSAIQAIYVELNSQKIESMEIGILENEELLLKLNKERFTVDVNNRFREYANIEKKLLIKKVLIDKLNEELKVGLNGLFKDYLYEINLILSSSYANFKLTELKSLSNRTLKESFFCDYAFIFDDSHVINILDEECKPQFKSTLSDSDKRIFAFAFFIAKLKKDNLLTSRIVILDDPFTSLDEERKDTMINILNKLACKQLIVLSHSRTFIKRYLSIFKSNESDSSKEVKSLRLINCLSKNKTKITNLDIEIDNDFLEGIEKYLNTLNRAKIESIESDYDNIRKIIEYIVKAKYGSLLSVEERRMPMRYFNNPNCKSQMKDEIKEKDYQENHHDLNNQPSPEELISKKDYFIDNVLPFI